MLNSNLDFDSTFFFPDQDEMLVSLATCKVSTDPLGRELVVVGTAVERMGEVEASEGRIWLFEVI